VPLLSGFFSKDAILSAAYAGGHQLLWAAGLFGAVLTAFYMFRLVFLTFHGSERLTPEAKARLHESPPSMTIPLFVLAGLAALGGWIGLPAVLGEKADLLRRFLAPVVPAGHGSHLSAAAEWGLILASSAAAGLGLALAWLFYRRSPAIPARLAARLPWAHKLLLNKYYVDEAYDAVFVRPLVRGSEIVHRRFDLAVIDGAVEGTGSFAERIGRWTAALQTGRIKDYALGFLLGAAAFLGLVLL
jgi:NADH-quinone oxidoreductase subunit L